MTRVKRVFGWAAAGGTAFVLVAGPAAAAKPLPGNDGSPAQPDAVVIRERPVPVEDTQKEILQIVLAGVFGATLASAVSVSRDRKMNLGSLTSRLFGFVDLETGYRMGRGASDFGNQPTVVVGTPDVVGGFDGQRTAGVGEADVAVFRRHDEGTEAGHTPLDPQSLGSWGR